MTTSDYFGGFGGRIWFERPNEPSSQTTAITGSSNIIINHVSSQNVTEPEETDGAVYISSVLWLTGITASLGAVLNIFVIFLIYKGGRQWKNHRHVYYVFTSVSALIFAGGTSTNSLAMATSGINLFPDFGSCLMVQATAMGSFSMIGIGISLLTHDLYNHVVYPISPDEPSKASGDAIKCVGCYFFAVLVGYLPFFFWQDHPLEVKICSLSTIFGHHWANYFAIAYYSAIILAILATNAFLIKAIKSIQWRTNIRVQRDFPSSQITRYRASENSPSREIKDGTDGNVTSKINSDVVEQEDAVVQETSFTEVSGTSQKTLLRDGLSPKTHKRISCLDMPFSASSNSIRIHETTVDMSNRQAEQRHNSNADLSGEIANEGPVKHHKTGAESARDNKDNS